MSNIVLIDDVITKNHSDAKALDSIVTSKGYSLEIINKKNDIDEFIANPPINLKLVLLDLDLSGLKNTDSESILKILVNKGIKVIMLSGLPKTVEKRRDKGYEGYQLELPDMNRLYDDCHNIVDTFYCHDIVDSHHDFRAITTVGN